MYNREAVEAVAQLKLRRQMARAERELALCEKVASGGCNPSLIC